LLIVFNYQNLSFETAKLQKNPQPEFFAGIAE